MSGTLYASEDGSPDRPEPRQRNAGPVPPPGPPPHAAHNAQPGRGPEFSRAPQPHASPSRNAPGHPFGNTFGGALAMDRRDSDEEDEQGAAVMMAPHEEGRTMSAAASHVSVRPFMADMERFLRLPAPKECLVKCYIIRDREKSKSHPTYRLYLYEDDGFMLSAVKRKHNRTSNYMISLEEKDLIRER